MSRPWPGREEGADLPARVRPPARHLARRGPARRERRGGSRPWTARSIPTQADREWRENTDQSKPRNRITGSPKHARVAGRAVGADGLRRRRGPAATAPRRGYAKARAARELYQAQLAKLELDRQRGILVRADEVRLGAFNMARKARDQLIALPERVAAILAATQDPAEVQRILEEEIERICQEIADAERP